LPSSLPRSDARLRLIAAILVGVIGPEVFIVQPGFVQGLVQNLGFDDQGAGYAASIEVWGITATTLVMTFFSHRFNWRKVIIGSLLVVAVTNAACIAVHSGRRALPAVSDRTTRISAVRLLGMPL
jgi:predicted MFS family arabinose efflux permease